MDLARTGGVGEATIGEEEEEGEVVSPHTIKDQEANPTTRGRGVVAGTEILTTTNTAGSSSPPVTIATKTTTISKTTTNPPMVVMATEEGGTTTRRGTIAVTIVTRGTTMTGKNLHTPHLQADIDN